MNAQQELGPLADLPNKERERIISKYPEVEHAKRQVRTLCSQTGIRLETLVEYGKQAEKAIADPSIYPKVLQNAISAGLVPQQFAEQTEINYELISQAIAIGKLAEMIIEDNQQ